MQQTFHRLNQILISLFILLVTVISIISVSHVYADTIWQPETKVAPVDPISFSQTNARCIAANGSSLHIVWIARPTGSYNQVAYSRSIDNGSTWGITQYLGNPDSSCPSIAVINNNVHIVFKDSINSTTKIVYMQSSDNGVSWGNELVISGDVFAGEYPCVSVSGNRIHAVWNSADQSNIWYVHSLDNGITWTAPLSIHPGNSSASISACGDTVHVVFFVRSDPNIPGAKLYMRSEDNGATWGAVKNLGDFVFAMPAEGGFLSMAASSNAIHVIWNDYRDGNHEIYYKRSLDNGDSWSDDTRITTNAGDSIRPAVAVDTNNISIVWEDTWGGTKETFYKTSSDNGTTWEQDKRLSSSTYSSLHPFIALNNNNVHVTWMSEGFVYYRLGLYESSIPPSVATDNSTNIATTSATLNGNLTSLGSASTCNVTFQWGTVPSSYSAETDNQTKGSSDNFTANLLNLTPNTTYYFRSKAVGDGTGYGEEKSFKTLITNPAISVNPTTVDFGFVEVGTSSTSHTITIINTGTTNLIVSTITIGGRNADQFHIASDNASNQTIPAGSSRYIMVKLTPTKAGDKRAIITIPSNAPVQSVVEVTLNGVATKKPPIPINSPTGIVTFDIVGGELITGLVGIPESTLPPNGKPSINFLNGFFSFTITGVDIGGSAIVTMTFPSNIPTNCQYWKYNNGWVNVTSLVGDNDGDNVITLTLTDGGLGDADGIKNGMIVDPGGIGIPVSRGGFPMISTTSHGGSAPAIISPPTPIQLSNIYVQQAAISSTEVAPTDTVNVTVYVTNKSSVNGQANIRLLINGVQEESKGVSVTSGSTIPVTFTVHKSQPGIYNVSVNNTPAGSFSVSDNSTILYISIACLLLAFVLGVVLIYRKVSN